MHRLSTRAEIGCRTLRLLGRGVSEPNRSIRFSSGVQPIGQSPTLERGYGRALDATWQIFCSLGAAISPSEGTVIRSDGNVLQYQLSLLNRLEWLTPVFRRNHMHARSTISGRVITTATFGRNDSVPGINYDNTLITASGKSSTTTRRTSGALAAPGSGSTFAMQFTVPSMMLRMVFVTHDTLVTPANRHIELRYSVSGGIVRRNRAIIVVAGESSDHDSGEDRKQPRKSLNAR